MKRLPTVFAIAFLILGNTALADVASGRPNVIFILADDLGWSDLGSYGNDVHQTPHLDQLAEQGMRFTNAYAASSVCSPTRASILTGKYPARIDLTMWLTGISPADAELRDAQFVGHLPREEVTLAEALREAGYATASIGKWHLGRKRHSPKHQGFELNVTGGLAGYPRGGYFLPNRMNLPGAKKGDYLTDRLTDEALKFIGANRATPFFLYLPYYAVHTPIEGKPGLVESYTRRMERTGEKFNPAYAAMVHGLDENVGRILRRLDELQLTDRTLVIFFSDNGGYDVVTSNAPLRAGKGYSYEGGHREPLIVRFPGTVQSAAVSDQPVISTDFYPTILDAVGLPLKTDQHVDGVSLKDPAAKLDRDALYWHFPHYSPQGGTPSGAIRVGNWKLIEFFEDDKLELYDLGEDVGETTDLAGRMPEKVKELHERLLAWREQVDAKLPRSNPNRARATP
jgi:arylsulfatase A-like enzyme